MSPWATERLTRVDRGFRPDRVSLTVYAHSTVFSSQEVSKSFYKLQKSRVSIRNSCKPAQFNTGSTLHCSRRAFHNIVELDGALSSDPRLNWLLDFLHDARNCGKRGIQAALYKGFDSRILSSRDCFLCSSSGYETQTTTRMATTSY